METITPASGAANPLEQLDKRRACSGFAGLLRKSTRKAQRLVPRVSGRENRKTTFRSPKSCFFNLHLEGSPFAMALWAAGKST